jgi:hypothetical protein
MLPAKKFEHTRTHTDMLNLAGAGTAASSKSQTAKARVSQMWYGVSLRSRWLSGCFAAMLHRSKNSMYGGQCVSGAMSTYGFCSAR